MDEAIEAAAANDDIAQQMAAVLAAPVSVGRWTGRWRDDGCQQRRLLGFDVHVQTDYGDEMAGRTPWELFDEADARQALDMAEEAVSLAQEIIQGMATRD